MPKKIGEFELIDLIAKKSQKKAVGLVRGIGDDCAVTRHCDKDVITTTDMLVESVHFDKKWTDMRSLGWKSLAVNISDVAAMGGQPKYFFVCIAVPKHVSNKDILEMYSGMNACAKKFKCTLAGGDTVKSPDKFVISITLIGEVAKGKALLRSGAKVGDSIYVTGNFGGAGLALYLERKRVAAKNVRNFLGRLHKPIPRVKEGLFLSKSKLVTSAIDTSDGLFADLSHIADESGVGFEIFEEKIPQENRLSFFSKKYNLDPAVLALSGGEDYELVFTVRKGCDTDFERLARQARTGAKFNKIGVIVKNKKFRKCLDKNGNELELASTGFDHFRS